MLQGLKTFIVAILIIVFGALETFDFTKFLSAETAGIVTTIIGIIMFILRTMTKTPPLKKEEK